MSNNPKMFEELERARLAEELINNPLWTEAHEEYTRRLKEEWANSPARDAEGREKIWLMLKAAEAAKRHLQEIINTGKLASIQMEQWQSVKDRAKAWLGAGSD